MEDIKSAPKGSFFLLHACAHNPTGVDPTKAQVRTASLALAPSRFVTSVRKAGSPVRTALLSARPNSLC